MLRAVESVHSLWTRCAAVLPNPTGQTSALSGLVIAIRSVLADAFLLASFAEGVRRTWMLAGETDIAWFAHVLAGDVIACFVVQRNSLPTFLLASDAVETVGARLRTVRTLPTARADALSGVGITRTVVLAVAEILAVVAETTQRTRRLAGHTFPFRFANAFTRDRIATQTVPLQASADLSAVWAEESRLAGFLAQIAVKT